MSKSIKYVCCKCKSENVDIMSIKERTIISDNKKIPTVDITYICTDCGNTENINEFLYKSNTQYLEKQNKYGEINNIKK